MDEDRTIVVGAGYAGVTAANRLAGHGVPVTLLAAREHFVERIRLHQVAAGQRDHARVALGSLLHADVRLVHGVAVRVRSDDHEVDLADGTTLPYASLVLAVGAGAADPDAFTVTDEEDAMRVRAALEADPAAPVAVVGAGLTGVEAATALALAGRTVTLHARHPLDGPDGRAFDRRLGRLGVRIAVGDQPARGSVVVRATGFRAQPLAADSGLPVDERGLLIVAGDLSVPGHPDVFGAGDAIRLSSTGWPHLRAACATAMPLGAHAADSVLARRSAQAGSQFTLGYVARCVDLGAGVGRAQFVDRRDRPVPFAFTGRLGGWAKETINRMTLRWIRGERDRAGSYRWASASGRPQSDRVAARVP